MQVSKNSRQEQLAELTNVQVHSPGVVNQLVLEAIYFLKAIEEREQLTDKEKVAIVQAMQILADLWAARFDKNPSN